MRDPLFSSDDPFIRTIPLRESAERETLKPLVGDTTTTKRRGIGRVAMALAPLCGLLLAVLPV